MSYLSVIWRWYANIIGVLVIAVSLSAAIVYAYNREGPVVEFLHGPLPNEVLRVPYMGLLTYRVSTQRHESCPGTVVRRFKLQSPNPVVILIPVMVPASEIRVGISDTLVGIQLPPAIYPGTWEFSATVDSRCPMRKVTEITSRFLVEVLPVEVLPVEESK